MTEEQRERNRENKRRWQEANPNYRRDWARANPDRVARAQAKHYRASFARDPLLNRRRHLQQSYGLTIEAFDLMLAQQDGRCAICRTTKPGGKHSIMWHIDHCHDTGKVRGLLCANCNSGIGFLGDNAAGVRRALAYLERFECQTTNQQSNNRPSIPPTQPMAGQSKVLPFTGPVAKPSTNSSAETRSQNLKELKLKSA